MTDKIDTSPEAVEQLATYHDWRDDGDSDTAATLRSLSARVAELEVIISMITTAWDQETENRKTIEQRAAELEAKLERAMQIVEMIASADVDAVLGEAVDLSCEIIGELMDD